MEPVSLTSKRTASYAALDGIACDFAHALVTSLGHPVVLAKPLSDADITKFSAFRESAVAGLATLAFRMVPLKGSVLVAIPVQLVQALVDLDYGGDGSFNAERKDLLPSEQRFFERLERFAAQALAGSWKEGSQAEATAIRLDLAMGIPAAFALDEEVAVHRFEIGISQAKPHGCLLVTPTAMLRSLPQADGPSKPAHESADPVWKAGFAEAILQVRLPVRTIFAQPELPLTRLLSLQPGEIIPLHLSDRLPVIVGGCRFADASMGEANGRVAIRIETTPQGPAYHE